LGKELEGELERLGFYNACEERGTARKRRFQLARDVRAVEKRIRRELTTAELLVAFNEWHLVSQEFLDSGETGDGIGGESSRRSRTKRRSYGRSRSTARKVPPRCARGGRVIEQRLDEWFSYFWLLKFGEFRKFEIPIRNRYVKRRCCFI
jgi:hypothetical protein